MSDLQLTLLIPGIGAALIYLVGRRVSRRNELLAALSALLLAVSLYVIGGLWLVRLPLVESLGRTVLVLDAMSLLMISVVHSLAFLICLYSGRYLALDHRYEDYYPLLLLLVSGVTAMLVIVDLFSLYLATVLASAATFVLVSFRRRSDTSVEAGFKYTIMGTVASILILAGLAYVFQVTGQLVLPLRAGEQLKLLLRTGSGLMLAGYAIKAGLAPAHTWLPDAHGRAPSSVSAMLSGVIVQTSMLVMVRVGMGSGLDRGRLGWIWVAMGLLSVTVGNLMALRQTYGKRLLAYSTVAQCGYVLTAIGLGVATGSEMLVAAGVFLMVVHVAMKAGAFLSKGVLHYYCGTTTLDDLIGQGGAMPWISACFSLSIAGLAGVAPLAGFMAKVQLLRGLLSTEAPGAIWVLAAVLLNVLLGFWVYLPLLARPWQRPLRERRARASCWMLVPVSALLLATVVFGLWSGPLYRASLSAATALLSWGW